MRKEDAIGTLAPAWRERAIDLDRYSPAAAAAFRECAADLERAVAASADATLSLKEAAEESGYSIDRVRHLVAEGAIPNAGRKHKPLIRRGDLPRRMKRGSRSQYDPAADAVRLTLG